MFKENCDPIELQGEHLSYFLYADDLVLISHTEKGLQNSLDELHSYSIRKSLSVSIKKSKTMIFNLNGRLIKRYFNINGMLLEPVHTFCYLGFDIKASGIVSHARNTLQEKANKAMRPLLHVIARFNIPVKTSLNLFHSYIAPIALYNAENWISLSDKQIQNFTTESIFLLISDNKTDILHRKFLRYILGVSPSCPNMAVYGETGENPLSLKGLRLMLNFWHRINNLPENTLAKKALLENINLRTNWIITIEKLLGTLGLTEVTENTLAFKRKTKQALASQFSDYWCKTVSSDSSRLRFYKSVKNKPDFETYLNLPLFEQRKSITKLRCSDHLLQIEKGRHHNVASELRFCRICPLKVVETEEHFLTNCTFFYRYKLKYNLLHITDAKAFMLHTEPAKLGSYIFEALSERKKYQEWFGLE